MKGKLLTLLFVGGLIFVGMGDMFLPKPLSQWSLQTRRQINEVLLGSFNPKMNRPSKRREDAVEAAEQGTGMEDPSENE
ncbi:MAG: hypothetical protein AB4041_11750 [Microcystaceae cyanobacterium]